jgi:hypothetical protein
VRKVTAKDIHTSTLLVQSLEGIPKMRQTMKIDLVFYCHKDCDQAVKNQMLEGSDSFQVYESLKDIDST